MKEIDIAPRVKSIKSGRKKLFDYASLPDLLDTYYQLGTMTKTADYYGCSRRTIYKYLKQAIAYKLDQVDQNISPEHIQVSQLIRELIHLSNNKENWSLRQSLLLELREHLNHLFK